MGNNQPKPDPFEFGRRLNAVLNKQADAPPIANGRGKWLAKRYKVSQPSAHAWLHGRNTPASERAREMAVDFGVDFDWFYFGIGEHDGTATAPIRTEEPEPEKHGSQWVRKLHLTMATRLIDEALTEEETLPPAEHAEALILCCDLLEDGWPKDQVVQITRRAIAAYSTRGNNGTSRKGHAA